LVHHFIPGNKTVNGVQSTWLDSTQKFMIATSERYCETLGKLNARQTMNSSSHETACPLTWHCWLYTSARKAAEFHCLGSLMTQRRLGPVRISSLSQTEGTSYRKSLYIGWWS
jgi:hypothetical protein